MSASLDDKSPVAGTAGNVPPDRLFQLSPAELVAELADADIEYPLAIIREIQRRKETMVPALIQVIEDATSKVRSGELVSCAPALALSLLIEFQAAEALDPLLASVSLPGEGPFELYGDLITEMLPLLVPSIGSNDVDAVLVKIRDRSVDEYVRWSLVSGLTLLYDAGRRSKVEVEQWLEALLREAIATADGNLALPVASEIQHINATGLLDLVGQAFDADLIPLDFFGPKANYYKDFAKHPSTRREWTVSDTATELESWFSVEDADSPVGLVGPHERELDEPFDPELLSFREPGGTVRYDQRHVGRNEACPCGSGKKYKKCCGRAGALPDL